MQEYSAIRLDDNGEVDDVAISGDLFRMERMDNGCWWIAVYRGENRTCFSLSTKRNVAIKAVCGEDSIHCIDDTPR